MKIWKAFYRSFEGNFVSWHATRAEAVTWMKAIKNDQGPAQGPTGVEEMDCPTERDAFIEWLNANMNTENG